MNRQKKNLRAATGQRGSNEGEIAEAPESPATCLPMARTIKAAAMISLSSEGPHWSKVVSLDDLDEAIDDMHRASSDCFVVPVEISLPDLPGNFDFDVRTDEFELAMTASLRRVISPASEATSGPDSHR